MEQPVDGPKDEDVRMNKFQESKLDILFSEAKDANPAPDVDGINIGSQRNQKRQ